MSIKLALCPMAPSVLGLRPKPPPSRREVFFGSLSQNDDTGRQSAHNLKVCTYSSLREGAGTA